MNICRKCQRKLPSFYDPIDQFICVECEIDPDLLQAITTLEFHEHRIKRRMLNCLAVRAPHKTAKEIMQSMKPNERPLRWKHWGWLCEYYFRKAAEQFGLTATSPMPAYGMKVVMKARNNPAK